MANLTLKAEIDHGRITVDEPDKLPVTGKALLTILDTAERKPDWEKIKSILGTMEMKIDGAAYEGQVRAEWDEREQLQWSTRTADPCFQELDKLEEGGASSKSQ